MGPQNITVGCWEFSWIWVSLHRFPSIPLLYSEGPQNTRCLLSNAMSILNNKAKFTYITCCVFCVSKLAATLIGCRNYKDAKPWATTSTLFQLRNSSCVSRRSKLYIWWFTQNDVYMMLFIQVIVMFLWADHRQIGNQTDRPAGSSRQLAGKWRFKNCGPCWDSWTIGPNYICMQSRRRPALQRVLCSSWGIHHARADNLKFLFT